VGARSVWVPFACFWGPFCFFILEGTGRLVVLVCFFWPPVRGGPRREPPRRGSGGGVGAGVDVWGLGVGLGLDHGAGYSGLLSLWDDFGGRCVRGGGVDGEWGVVGWVWCFLCRAWGVGYWVRTLAGFFGRRGPLVLAYGVLRRGERRGGCGYREGGGFGGSGMRFCFYLWFVVGMAFREGLVAVGGLTLSRVWVRLLGDWFRGRSGWMVWAGAPGSGGGAALAKL